MYNLTTIRTTGVFIYIFTEVLSIVKNIFTQSEIERETENQNFPQFKQTHKNTAGGTLLHCLCHVGQAEGSPVNEQGYFIRPY